MGRILDLDELEHTEHAHELEGGEHGDLPAFRQPAAGLASSARGGNPSSPRTE